MVAHDEIGGLLPIKRTIRVLDVNNQSFREQEEPSNKRVRPLARVTSLANLISPVRNGAVRRFGQTIQSFTLRGDSRSPASAQKSSSRSTVPIPAKRRSSVLWSEMLDVTMKESLTAKEIRRQEVGWRPAARPYMSAFTQKNSPCALSICFDRRLAN